MQKEEERSMSRVLIVYASDTGNTKKMAEAVAEGVRSVTNAEAVVKAAPDVEKKDLIAADAIMLGSPVHMGSCDWRIKQFIDLVTSPCWMKDELVGKVGAVFASGSGYGVAGGGAEMTMLSMLNDLAECGCLLVPLPKNTPGYSKGGLQWGAYAATADEQFNAQAIPDGALQAARAHGANVARVADAVYGRTLFGS
jgi:NAD(P)H dehydrogenase (quinone)